MPEFPSQLTLADGVAATRDTSRLLVCLAEPAIEGAPVRRIGVPDDVAAACEFIVSEDSGFFTGQVVSPNGGRYM